MNPTAAQLKNRKSAKKKKKKKIFKFLREAKVDEVRWRQQTINNGDKGQHQGNKVNITSFSANGSYTKGVTLLVFCVIVT